MDPVRTLIYSTEAGSGEGRCTLTLYREDFTALYPGMVRFDLRAACKDRTVAVFRTNTYEYSPLVPLEAEKVALKKAGAWEREISSSPEEFLMQHHMTLPARIKVPVADLVVIQGSPRPDGNCGILASWASAAAIDLGRTARVIYPHDLDIHGCTGCYQCYNTGTCIFDDDMTAIIDAIRGASLIIVCSPVYTNTVPGGLKLLIDRAQAYHAERVLAGGRTDQKGLVFSVAGRRGEGNFTCVTRVVSAFFKNLGIEPVGQLLADRADAIRDIRTREGREQQAKDLVSRHLILKKS